jgi:hypothetical protein
MSHAMSHRHGSILLFMLGLLTVMLVIAFAFVTTMQMARETAKLPRRQSLARLAAEMGMQHAIAVCQQGYAMSTEVRDASVMSAVSRIDSPHKNVFNILSPRRGAQPREQQPPLPWDLAPDVSFQDLLWGFNGTYHQGPGSGTIMRAFSDGWTMDRGYARLFEANRFTLAAGTVYNPSTYDSYDLSPLSASPQAYPNPAPVASPFPPVDPFVTGKPIVVRHALDHPLWLDADYRPVAGLDDPSRGPVRARYRLRYAVYVQDMSLALWLNTEAPWLAEGEVVKQRSLLRSTYGEAIASAGAVIGRKTSVPLDYGVGMASVFRGYGQYGNSRFDASKPGIPLDWPERGGQPMYYRGPLTTFSWYNVQRAIHNVHGSPFMDWNDPDPSNPAKRRWIGSALTSWNDLAFAIQDHTKSWHVSGETSTVSNLSQDGLVPVRGEPMAQRIATPFGRPYAAATDHPWAVNLLVAPMKVIEAMVAAYVPPDVRSTWKCKTPSSTTGGGPMLFDVALTPGPGADLFTDAFRPGGRQPFVSHPPPADRDYWTTAARTNHVNPVDARPSADRYPGGNFFSDPLTETGGSGTAPSGTVWSSLTAEPKQVGDDPAFPSMGYDPYPIYRSVLGGDHLGRHIVFHDPSASMTVGKNDGYLSSHFIHYTQNRQLGPANTMNPVSMPQTFLYAPIFTPMAPFGTDMGNLMGESDFNIGTSQPSNTISGLAIGFGGGAFSLRRPDSTGRGVVLHGTPNSYWHRLALAYVHAVVVGQIANLAWADPQDARSQSFWPTYSAPGWANKPTPVGIIYTKTPALAVTAAMRKGPANGWDPAAAHFSNEQMIDRQFLANLGESFDQPGRLTPADAMALVEPATGVPRPPRFSKCQTDYWDGSRPTAKVNHIYSAPSSSTFAYGSFLVVGEYRVNNNIRTLLTPIDKTTGATLTPSSTDPQIGLNAPPRNLWLLDEWKAGPVIPVGDPGYTEYAAYTPGTAVGQRPTLVARARAKLMERVLNDWRMSFLGSTKGYAASFRPKDFDGDGLVFCSGYLGTAAGASDPETGLTCWQGADPATGDGPGIGVEPGDPATATPARKLTLFSVTGCMAFQRSHQYKIQVRGELFDNVMGKAVSEQYLESALLVDPDNDVARGAMPSGLTDTTVIMQRPIHNYYRGYLTRSYP